MPVDEQNAAVDAEVEAEDSSGAVPYRGWLIALTVVAGVQTLLVLALFLGGWVTWYGADGVFGKNGAFGARGAFGREGMFGADGSVQKLVDESLLADPEFYDDDLYMNLDAIGMDVSYYLDAGNVDDYLALYDADDPHVDLDAVRAEFEAAVATTDPDSYVEFMPYGITAYTDAATGESIARITLQGMDYDSGRPTGDRLTVYAITDDAPDYVLTGDIDRDLTDAEMVW